jgi:uncharacterized protein with von Willebrand factor type A (vWA) domain
LFLTFLYALRAEGVPVGLGEWDRFLYALRIGLISDDEALYRVGRAILCRSEADFDGFDRAFGSVFEGIETSSALQEAMAAWLAEAADRPQGTMDPKEYQDYEDLWRDFLKRLAEQSGRHDGGNTWIGTRGTSAFGHSGRAPAGIRVGGSGGGRSAIQVAGERRWSNYRSDRTLDVRETKVALRALRSLARDGRPELDLDETISETARNAGDISLVERPERKNRLRVVLLMDAGGSMAPHAERVEQLFSALQQLKAFRSLDVYYFHNCVYGWLYRDFEELDKVPTERVIADLTPAHRLLFVGDASMAPYELHAAWGWSGAEHPSGLDWLRRFKRRCPASVWLNPDPPKWWNHPTVSAIGEVFPMFELTVDGLRAAVKKLRAPP